MKEVALRPLVDSDRAAVLELMATSLGHGPMGRTPESWSWKHRESPFGASPGLVAEADGRLVGLRLFLRWRWRAGEAVYDAVRAVDTATHPDWRGRGIFRRLTEGLVEQVADEGVAFVFNTPNEQSRPGYLKMGWRDVSRLWLWIRPCWRRILTLPWRMVRRGAAGIPPLPGRPVEELLTEPGLDAWLAGLTAGEERLHTPRDAGYLAWRYTAPGLGYRALWCFDGERRAALVMRIRRRGVFTEAGLCEVLVGRAAASQRCAVGLLRELLAGAHADYLVACAATRTPEQRVLLRTGFVPLTVPRHFTVRPLCPLPVDLARWRSWRPSLGDLELF